MKTTQTMAIQPKTGPHLPSFHGPGVNALAVDPSQEDRDEIGHVEPNDRDRRHGGVGRRPVEPGSNAGAVRMKAPTAPNQAECTGTRLRLLTWCQ